jgi:tRNA dimethylallyltransferase
MPDAARNEDARPMIATENGRPDAVLIAGPTASGKSALAIAVAERVGGLVINADSMQVYAELRILTARPTVEDEARVEHRLYGDVSAARDHSVADWLKRIAPVLDEAVAAGRPAVIVGGTGLYFDALVHGLAEVPPIPEAIRRHWRERAGRDGVERLHAELTCRDPEGAARLRPSDTQRVTRALEVLEATGRPLSSWQLASAKPLLPVDRAVAMVVEPDRAELHRRIALRFRDMVASGAVEEAAAFAGLGIERGLPATRAIGLSGLAEVAAGRRGLEAAIEKAVAETRQYAKRQSTYFRGRMGDWSRGEPDVLAARAIAALGH